jgi:N-carbamoylputrescine amidase
MRVAIVEWPEGLVPNGEVWSRTVAEVIAAEPDLLITNELPFGPWIAASASFNNAIAEASVAIHERGMAALARLGIPAILSSRAVWENGRLANEAVAIEAGTVRGIHRKQYFPAEPGWYEATWYGTRDRDFTVASLAGVTVGVLLCTEAMFNEHARAYRRQGASLIAIPRAAGKTHQSWHIAGAMAALTGGAYVASSNRVGAGPGGPEFGGGGFAYAPGGDLIGATCADTPLVVFDLDPVAVARRQREYPCYVAERG